MATNLVYFGTPQFSADILEYIINQLADINVVAVVTNPDRPVGRQHSLTPSPVAQVAAKYHLPTFKPSQLDAANLAHLKLLQPDVFLVAAYGKIIPNSWLSTPKIKSLNIHFSLLPRYRGALCIQEALKNGDLKTGVTLMEMDDQMDHGSIISQLSVNIDDSDNVATLQTKLTQVSFDLLARNLPEYLKGKLMAQPQDESSATYTPSLKTHTHQTALIPWKQIKSALDDPKLATQTHNLIRSLNPEPGAWTTIPQTDNQPLQIKILQTRLSASGQLEILSVQLPGKAPISWKQFAAGYQID